MTIGSQNLYHAPGEVVRQLIINLQQGTTGTAYQSWPVFVDNEPNEPDNCITIEEIQGNLDGILQPTGQMLQHFGFHIMLRSVRGTTGNTPTPGYRLGRNKIDTICQQLNENVSQLQLTMDSITYLVTAMIQISAVDVLGKIRDNSGRYRFTVDYQSSIIQLT